MKKIKNKFFDLVLLILSFFFSIFRSVKALFGCKKTLKKSSFFDVFDFVFRLWPSQFWKKPSFFKIGVFLGSFIKHIFYNDKK